MPTNPGNPVQVIADIMAKYPQDRRPLEQWSDGKLCSFGNCYLVADGIGTFSRFKSWLATLRKELKKSELYNCADFINNSRGVSYSRYGYHYLPGATNITIPQDCARIVKPYVVLRSIWVRDRPHARRHNMRHRARRRNLSLSYIAFSLGGPVVVLGVASHLRNKLKLRKIKSLILVQPAFRLHRQTIKYAGELELTPIPTPINNFIFNRNIITSELNEAIEELARHHIPMTMIYWEGDRFISYKEEDRNPGDKDFMKTLREAGVKIIKIDEDNRKPDLDKDALEEHREIASDNLVVNYLAELLCLPRAGC